MLLYTLLLLFAIYADAAEVAVCAGEGGKGTAYYVVIPLVEATPPMSPAFMPRLIR